MKLKQSFLTSVFLVLSMIYTYSLIGQDIFGHPIENIKNVSLSPSKAVYTISTPINTFGLSLTKSKDVVIVRIRNRNGKLMGEGKVSSRNGSIHLSARKLHKGTLSIWAFAASVIQNQRNEVNLRKPVKRPFVSRGRAPLPHPYYAFANCYEQCQASFSGVQGNFFTSHSSSEPGPIIPVTFSGNTFNNSWESFYDCVQNCMY